MDNGPGVFEAGDRGDLAWLDARADETNRARHEAVAEFDRLRKEARVGASTPEAFDRMVAMMRSIPDLTSTARLAKQARDDAYTAQDLLLEPPAPTFESIDEAMEWIHLMYEHMGDAVERCEAAKLELDSLLDLYEQSLTAEGDERLRLLDEAEQTLDRRIDLVLKAEQARKDYDAAKAAVDRIARPPSDVAPGD